ncbi:MAG TPA: SIS domain-containing protein [Pyrinomonadaceae bacterium]|nr:SIS domain-containing protein [Pyrinomonadaceae bacterium]
MSLMLEEIAEQPAALEKTLKEERSKYEALARTLSKKDIDLIVLVARGSSDNAALFGRYLIEVNTGIPVSLAAPSVYTLYNAKLDLSRSLVVGVSQSGEGADINLVLESAKASGALTLAITNEAESSMAKLADETLLIHAGRERSVAATKTYSGQMLHFYLLTRALGGADPGIASIPELVADAHNVAPEIRELVERYVFMENCVVVGRGVNYGNSYELALKLMETCYVVAERFSTADFFHGPLAVVERRFPVIMFAPAGVTKASSLELLEKLKDLHADCLSITNDKDVAAASPRSVQLQADVDEFLTPIPFIVPAQLFAAYLSAAKGLDPDAPRSLSKVTITV